MLQILKMQEKDKESIVAQLNAQNTEVQLDNILNNVHNCFVVKENNNIHGFGYFKIHDDFAQIVQLIIFKNTNENEYMDILIRALINAIDLKGLEIVKINKKTIDNTQLLENIGFRLKKNCDDILELNTKDFFQCKCCK